MMGATAYVAVVSDPPLASAARNMVQPDTIDFATIITLVGGTVGGYITYAGTHRMLEAGIHGKEHIRAIAKSSITGIMVTGLMRFLLFLAILGVVVAGKSLAEGAPLLLPPRHLGTPLVKSVLDSSA